jgi:Ca2+-binding RTX toxin-like protein
VRLTRSVLALPVLAAALLVPTPAGAAPAQPTVPPDCAVPPDEVDLSQFNVIIGSDRSEVLTGTDGPDAICGRLGNDVIRALGGDDVVLGDTSTFFGNVQAPGGNDVISGGEGDDQILSGPGNDIVSGGGGDDFLALAVGNDIGNGGPGDDGMQGGFGRDILNAGAGADFAAGGPDADIVNGGSGDDFLFGEIEPGASPPPGVELPPPARDICHGGPGSDIGIDCDIAGSIEGDSPPA